LYLFTRTALISINIQLFYNFLCYGTLATNAKLEILFVG